MAQSPRPFRIGAGAGYAGDRIDPAQALAERGGLDALVFECLAERTIALAQLRRSRDPDSGYDPLLEARIRAVLPACVAQGVRLISNMGAANPAAAGAAVLAVARELGLPQVRVAWAGIAIYTWDVVFRASTVVGFFGAGGMGHHLRESVQRVQSRQVTAIILTIVAIVIVAELFSAWMRGRIARAVA